MNASLALSGSILWVARSARTAEVRAYDLDGRPLGPGFSFAGRRGGAASAAGIALDADRRLWIADRLGARVRCFTLFGRELDGLGADADPALDRLGAVGRPVAVASAGVEDEQVVWVASAGARRHALQAFERGGRVRSLRPEGDPLGAFRGLAGLAVRGERAWACEPGAARVQVFRQGEFHYLLRVAPGRRGAAAALALAPLSDGRLVVACAGERTGLLLVDAGGRLLRVLAEQGSEEGSLEEPCAVAVHEGERDRTTRVAALDRSGDRVQVFSLEGRCFGAFGDPAGACG